MRITITEEAEGKINELINGQEGMIKLKYETEGCGCVMSGVPTLWYVGAPKSDDDIIIETNYRPVLMEKSKRVFFDEELKIDFSKTANTFQLKSPGQIFNGTMAFRLYPEENDD
ncbi:iron-sulfur cluster biosynthesis family protein [Ectobacillus panaciterrae]|uniref:iron-sulfur cluster biosynthesis family protein n=1 Tax=Ectobacillus panaciterrae TaxID=363872 RepID=UPI0003F8345F|nr:iron-sulfur cluster biosynthesis family protein [Ectobacillus panaciterrae]